MCKIQLTHEGKVLNEHFCPYTFSLCYIAAAILCSNAPTQRRIGKDYRTDPLLRHRHQISYHPFCRTQPRPQCPISCKWPKWRRDKVLAKSLPSSSVRLLRMNGCWRHGALSALALLRVGLRKSNQKAWVPHASSFRLSRALAMALGDRRMARCSPRLAAFSICVAGQGRLDISYAPGRQGTPVWRKMPLFTL